MALFSWLFGKGKSKSDAPVYSDRWTVSENGNPTLLEGSTGITIFKQDRGWNYCIADVDDQNAPYFSEAFFLSRMHGKRRWLISEGSRLIINLFRLHSPRNVGIAGRSIFENALV